MLLVDRIAQRIRVVDGDNTMSAVDLGGEIAVLVLPLRPALFGADVIEFVEAANGDKAMGAGLLAERIVEHFRLPLEAEDAPAAAVDLMAALKASMASYKRERAGLDAEEVTK